MTKELRVEGLTKEQTTQIQEFINEAVQTAKDEVHAEYAAKTAKTPERPYVPLALKEYKSGQNVSVIQGFEWRDGTVADTNRWGLSVNTDKGPVTIATPNKIRPKK